MVEVTHSFRELWVGVNMACLQKTCRLEDHGKVLGERAVNPESFI